MSNNKDNCLINNSNSNNHSNNNIQDEQQNPTKRDNIKALLSKTPNEPVMFVTSTTSTHHQVKQTPITLNKHNQIR